MLSVENPIEVKSFFVAVHQVMCMWQCTALFTFINSSPLPLAIKVASPHLYIWVERECLAQERNTISLARAGT